MLNTSVAWQVELLQEYWHQLYQVLNSVTLSLSLSLSHSLTHTLTHSLTHSTGHGLKSILLTGCGGLVCGLCGQFLYNRLEIWRKRKAIEIHYPELVDRKESQWTFVSDCSVSMIVDVLSKLTTSGICSPRDCL